MSVEGEYSKGARPTIAAIATAPGAAGVAVIRMSGPAAHDVARKICPDLPRRPRMRRAYLSRLVSIACGSVLDEGLVLLFGGPGSFTGEDVAELHCHGGLAQPREVLGAVFAAGCEPAGRGAFTRRAVENGRMDLARAEGIAELVAADTDAGLRAARSLLGGSLSRRVEGMIEKVDELLAEAEGALDFPEETAGLDEGSFAPRAVDLGREAEALARTWRDSSRRRQGARAVLFGPPNSGKSSLLNALSGYERAIVDSAAGTTRDLLESRVTIDGEVVWVIDGAGVRPRSGRVEAAGVERIENAAREADLVLGVFDGSRPPDEVDERALGMLRELERPLLMVANKTDLGQAGREALSSSMKGRRLVATSALTGQGMEGLADAIGEAIFSGSYSEAEVIVTLERHHQALCATARSLEAGAALLEEPGALELACEELRDARAGLYEIVGRGALAETLLDRVFEKFCIGK